MNVSGRAIIKQQPVSSDKGDACASRRGRNDPVRLSGIFQRREDVALVMHTAGHGAK